MVPAAGVPRAGARRTRRYDGPKQVTAAGSPKRVTTAHIGHADAPRTVHERSTNVRHQVIETVRARYEREPRLDHPGELAIS
jgi:hypothetical protein